MNAFQEGEVDILRDAALGHMQSVCNLNLLRSHRKVVCGPASEPKPVRNFCELQGSATV